MSYDEFFTELKKSKNKRQFKDGVEQELKLAVRNYVRQVGYDVFAEEVEEYHQTLPPNVKKRRPETYAKWAGIFLPDDSRPHYPNNYRDKGFYRAYNSWSWEDENDWDFNRALMDGEDLEVYNLRPMGSWG